MFSSKGILELLSPFLSSGISDTPTPIKLDRYVHWLETNILLASRRDMNEIDDTLDQITERIVQLKNISSQCRSAMVAPNNAHVNKVYKMFDQVDTLGAPYQQGRLYNSAGKFPIPSLLPDAETLNDWITQTKLKLKSMEEVASSKKNEAVKFKGAKSIISIRGEAKKQVDMSLIRSEIRGIIALLDKLSVRIQEKAEALKYFAQIKECVHFPLQDFSIKLRTIPPMKEASARLEHELNALNDVDSSYRQLRSADVLVAAAKATRDAKYIESEAEDAIRNLRSLGSEEVYQFLSHLHNLNRGKAESPAEDSEAAVPPWLYNLRQLAELSNEKILDLCSPRLLF